MELQSRIDELKARGLGIAAISYDSPEVLADFAARRGITFPLLSDTGSATIKAYGLLNTTTAAPGTTTWGIPYPGTFVLDRDGRVTARFFEQAYQDRNTVSSILVKLGKAPPHAGQETTTAHLRVRSYASDDALVPGRHVSLVADISPNAGIHVYAPGATGYRVVALAVDDAAGLTVRETGYPASEPYVFAPLNETVPVFKTPFRLTRDVVFQRLPPASPGANGGSSITVTGRLEYQACDDRTCFNPVSVPLTWTFTAGALDRERSSAKR